MDNLDDQIAEYEKKVAEEQAAGRFSGTAAHIRLEQLLELRRAKKRKVTKKKNFTGKKEISDE